MTTPEERKQEKEFSEAVKAAASQMADEMVAERDADGMDDAAHEQALMRQAMGLVEDIVRLVELKIDLEATRSKLDVTSEEMMQAATSFRSQEGNMNKRLQQILATEEKFQRGQA